MQLINKDEEQMASLKYLRTLGNHLKSNSPDPESKSPLGFKGLKDMLRQSKNDLNLSKLDTDYLKYNKYWMNFDDKGIELMEQNEHSNSSLEAENEDSLKVDEESKNVDSV